MDDDDKTPGSKNLDGDCENKAPTLGQSTPILEGDYSNTELIYLLLDRKAATSPSTSLAGMSAPTTSTSSASGSTTSTASSSSKVSTPVTAYSSVRVSIPAMASSSATIYIPISGSSTAQVSIPKAFPSACISPPAIASSSAQVSPSTTTSSSDRDRKYRLIRDVGSEEGDMHPTRVLEALGEDLMGEKHLLEYYHFYAWSRYPVRRVVVRRERRIGGPGNGTLCWSQGGGKESVKIDKEEGKSQKSIIGWKRNFKFAENAGKRQLAIVKIGSQSYTFKLDELVTVEDEEKEKAAIVKNQIPRSFLCIYRLKPIMKSTADPHSSCRTVIHEADGQESPLVLPSSIQPVTAPQGLLSPQASSLHDSQSSNVGARIGSPQSFESTHPLVLPSSVQPLTGQENIELTEASSLNKEDLQCPIVDSGIDDLLRFFLEDETSSIGMDHFLDFGSADLGYYGDLQWPYLDSWLDQFQSWGSAHPGLDGQISPLALGSSAQPLAEQQDLQWPQASSLHDLQLSMGNPRIDDLENYGTADPEPNGDLQSWRSTHPGLDGQISPLALGNSAQPLAEQQDLQWPQASSLHDPQLPMGNSMIDDPENYGTGDPEPDDENSLLVLPASFQRLAELQDVQWPGLSLQEAQSTTLNSRVEDLQSWGSADPEPSGLDFLLDLPTSREHGQDLQLPEAPLGSLTSFPPAMQENFETNRDDEWNSVELIYKPSHMLYDQGWVGPFKK